jgi:hypothetical protein
MRPKYFVELPFLAAYDGEAKASRRAGRNTEGQRPEELTSGCLMILLAFASLMLIVWLVILSRFLTGGDCKELQARFVSLGNLAGKKYQEIVKVVGLPNARSGVADGKFLLQWMRRGYHICLLFKDDVCEGITREVAISNGPLPAVPNTAISAKCPTCNWSMKFDKRRAGQKMKCPSCKHDIMVPLA